MWESLTPFIFIAAKVTLQLQMSVHQSVSSTGNKTPFHPSSFILRLISFPTCFSLKAFLKNYYLFYPSVPTKHKFLFAHASVAGHVEYHEQITDHLIVHPTNNASRDLSWTYLYPAIASYVTKVLDWGEADIKRDQNMKPAFKELYFLDQLWRKSKRFSKKDKILYNEISIYLFLL